MIYDYILNTGDLTISGCISENLGTDRLSGLNVVPSNDGGSFIFNKRLITGEHETSLALGSQTLYQEIPTGAEATNETVYQIFTGDFFIKTGASEELDRSRLFFDSTTPAKQNSVIRYDKFTGVFVAGTGKAACSESIMVSGISNSLGSGIRNADPSPDYYSYDYFLNGQKIYNGFGVEISGIGGSDWIPYYSNNSTFGIVSGSNEHLFKGLAYKKTDRINNITGTEPDIFGTGFIEAQSTLYINGLRELNSIYLELYTGVTLIETGVTAIVDTGFIRPATGGSLSL